MKTINYIIFFISCLMGVIVHAETEEKQDKSNAKIISNYVNDYKKIEICFFWDNEDAVSMDKKDELEIAEILKKTRYKKPIKSKGHKEWGLYIKIHLENNKFGYIDLGSDGNIATYVNYGIPEENKKRFKEILRPYIDKAVPEKHRSIFNPPKIEEHPK